MWIAGDCIVPPFSCVVACARQLLRDAGVDASEAELIERIGVVDGQGRIAAAVLGGHGELFVQQFNAQTMEPTSALINAPPAEAAHRIDAELVVGAV